MCVHMYVCMYVCMYRNSENLYGILLKDIPCSPSPILPTSNLLTLDQKVAFHLLVTKQLRVTF